ncbi:cysteinyl-tRNA synthetase [Rhodoligotrophos appendicifer]|uniref:cysteine--tRNA ligase n=1 Tax=Rhodoligotrophos appendicifer TaxID=987056 RepID=UPI001185EB82|nr:cysteine--tRNA ligase [Rhodoligotrophos appendicifer]
MTLKLYNTLTRSKDQFRPIDPSNVRMYVCGPTVYDFAHIGNARPVIIFDVLYRLVRHLYGESHVTYVRNITDVDDKINARAAQDHPGLPLNEAIAKVTAETNAQFQADVTALGCLEPTHQPRATDNIPQMIEIIERLIARGHAYVAEGHVLFNVPSDTHYGLLSQRPLKEMQAGARVEVAPYKQDPMDFVLWKPSNEGEPGWDSPWGRGRPGWHIECSAMSWRYLGERFDIHGGGIDLVFPHHENELAQTTCAFGTDVMANIWMHNGFLQVEGQKMSKSLGNFVTIRDVLGDWPAEVVRLNMLKTHYRQPIDWTLKGLEESSKTLDYWYQADVNAPEAAALDEEVLEALSDDLNTPRAIARLHALFAQLGDLGESGMGDQRRIFKASVQGLGLMSRSAKEWFEESWQRAGVDQPRIRALIGERLRARKEKDWAEADRIRDVLLAEGIALKDVKDPRTGEPVTTWEVAR